MPPHIPSKGHDGQGATTTNQPLSQRVGETKNGLTSKIGSYSSSHGLETVETWEMQPTLFVCLENMTYTNWDVISSNKKKYEPITMTGFPFCSLAHKRQLSTTRSNTWSSSQRYSSPSRLLSPESNPESNELWHLFVGCFSLGQYVESSTSQTRQNEHTCFTNFLQVISVGQISAEFLLF